MEKQKYVVSDYIAFKGTEKQIKEIAELMKEEDWSDPRFTKYCHVWVYEGLGTFFFPREAYYGGEEDYVVALMKYGANHPGNYRSLSHK